MKIKFSEPKELTFFLNLDWNILKKESAIRPLILMSRSYKIKNFEYIQKTLSKQFIVLDIVNWDKHKKNCLFPIMFILSTIWIFRINHKANFLKKGEKTALASRNLQITVAHWCRIVFIQTGAEFYTYLLVKHYNDLLYRLSSERGKDEVTYFYVGDVFYIHLGTKYADFQVKNYAEISGKKFQTLGIT